MTIPYLVAIGSSTGAVKVLQEILKGLPSGKRAAILLVHHIARDFEKDFTDLLYRQSSYLPGDVKNGEKIVPETIYVAPSDYHLCVSENATIALSKDPPVDGFRPSATKLFQSIALYAPGRCIGIVLSGMGRDGAAGLLELAQGGGFTIAQDRATSSVFGMPDAAIKIGAATRVLGSSEIAKVVLDKLEEWNKNDYTKTSR